MRRRVLLIGFFGVVLVAALIGAVSLSSDDTRRGADALADSGEGPWAEVTLRVQGMT